MLDRRIKKIQCRLRMLIKALAYVKKHDPDTAELFAMLPKVCVIKMEVLNMGEVVTIVKDNNLIYTLRKGEFTKQEHLAIIFKNLKSLKNCVSGKYGLNRIFAEHNIMVRGDISNAVIFTQIINNVEYYVLPRLITRKYLTKRRLHLSRTLLYLYVLFHKEERFVNIEEAMA